MPMIEADEIVCATTTRALVEFLRGIKDPNIIDVIEVVFSKISQTPIDPEKAHEVAVKISPEVYNIIEKLPKIIRVATLTLMLKYELDNFPAEDINKMEEVYSKTFQKYKLT